MENEHFMMQAPGRICLFGEHQDYLALDIIALGMSLTMNIEGKKDPGRKDLLLELPDIKDLQTFDPRDPGDYQGPRDYLRACIKVLKKEGIEVPGGWRFRLTSTIPVNAGCGSSSVMCVIWIGALLHISGAWGKYDPEYIAFLANRAEVEEFGESGGIMDHLAASKGGLFHLECRPPFKPRHLPANIEGLVLVNPGEPKDTPEIIKEVKRLALEAIEIARKRNKDFDLRKASVGEALQAALEMEPELQAVLRAHIEDRELLKRALKELEKENPDLNEIGRALTEHHKALKQGLRISTERIDMALEKAMEMGALGGKLNGSGGGGTCFVLAPGVEDKVIKAMEEMGMEAWAVRKSPGLRLI